MLSLRNLDPDNVFFASDHHFGHANIIKYQNRPFSSVEEMDQTMIDAWNETVPKNGIVFHLGDFCLGEAETARSYFAKLNGYITILSNPWHHDGRWITQDPGGFITKSNTAILIASPMETLECPQFPVATHGRDRVIVLCHYPIAEWDRKHYGSWHLHGHSHGQFNYPPGSLALDVGVDSFNYAPVSLAGVAIKMREKEDDR